MLPSIRQKELLLALYGDSQGQAAFARLARIKDAWRARLPARAGTRLSAGDALLISYADQVRQPGQAPLQTLAQFCARRLPGLVSGIHLLPFYPYTSDDGFSVVDYRQVDPALGSWADIAAFQPGLRLMFDAVINHISVKSAWFQGYLAGEPAYRDYFIAASPDTDLSQVTRPRALPLLTPFATRAGTRHIWTTFSADQVDLNYRSPEVLLNILDLLLFYIHQGAGLIRLDAIAFLWKEIGTSCLHRPQTHQVIQLIRAVLDELAPEVLLITETNVLHADNLSYFGGGSGEAQLVYNFALPPLVLHAFQSGQAGVLANWAAGLALPSNQVTFFNFLASHDGIGLNPARGILSEAEIQALVAGARANGGLVSYKNNPDGSSSPYELNINYFDALSDPAASEAPELQAARFLTAQAIMLSLPGMPGIYFHSLFGSRGWPEGAAQSGQNRTINRQKLSLAELEEELARPGSLRRRVFEGYAALLRARSAHPAFDPYGTMAVAQAGPAVFGVLRGAGTGVPVLCLHNLSPARQPIRPGLLEMLTPGPALDLVSGQPLAGRAELGPYQTLWLASAA